MTVTYDLSKIDGVDFAGIYKLNRNSNKHSNETSLKEEFKKFDIHCTTCSTANGQYQILKYDKQSLTVDTIRSVGLFRSVILREDKIMGFSPPKSVKTVDLLVGHEHQLVLAEEFIEGTMINVFFDDSIGDEGDWEVSTRSNVGGRTAFFRDGQIDHEHTFRYMFLDALGKADLCLDNLSKDYSYSFVLQHPKNRIVIPIRDPVIYLVACYKIDNENYTVAEISREEQIDMLKGTTVCFAERFDFDCYEELREKWASGNTDYKIMGIILKNFFTGERSKLRNPNYESVRQLRGNQPKLQYQYLVLRKQGNVSKYLRYFDEAKHSFSTFRDQIHRFTQQLHTNYIMCYVKKNKPLIEYSLQYRTHMFNLHIMYLTFLREAGGKVSKQKVVEYVNDLHPAKLMFSLNFSMRQRQVEAVVNCQDE